MKQIETVTDTETERWQGAGESARRAGVLFDEVLVPLAVERQRAGASPYFPAGRDDTLPSYYVRPELSVMSAADFEFPGGGTGAGLVEALTTRWSAEGEMALCAATPHLHAIVKVLADEAVDDDASVDIFCYTLF